MCLGQRLEAATLHQSMRGETRCVASGAPRSGGGGGEAGSRKSSVRNFSNTTKFGWVFPRTKTRRQGVIDTVWLQEFALDIETLQSEIRRQISLVNKDEQSNHQRDCWCAECRSECCAPAMNGKDRVNTAPEMATSSRKSVSSSVQTRSLEEKNVISKKLVTGKSSLGVCCSEQGPAKMKVQGMTRDMESSGSEKSFVLDTRFNTYTIGAKCDEYSSMQSDISRDSGIFSTDDASIVSEVPGDKSLLQEIGEVLGDQDVSLEQCIHCGSLPLRGITPASKENASCPVWMTRFSSSNDLSAEYESQEWELEHSPFSCISPVTRRKSCTSEDSDGHVTSPPIECEKEKLSVSQCMTCEKLNEESPLNQLALQESSELAKFTQSFQALSARVEDLRSNLECLAGEVNESKRDFINLEKRTTQLFASTVTSRHRLANVRGLQLLEDRLQEEWWAAYDPNSISINENYIV